MNTAVTGSASTSGQPATGTPPAGTTTASSEAPWFNSIPDEGLRNFAQTKGWKDPAAVTEGYRNLEKLVGVPQDRLLKLPEKSDDPAWGDVYSRLGKPEHPDGYELTFEGDPGFAKRMSEVMHGANVPKPMAQALNKAWNDYVKEITDEQARLEEAENAAKAAKAEADMNQLRTDWGVGFQANEELAKRAARESGLTDDQFAAISASLGAVETLKLFQGWGVKIGEPAAFDPGKQPGTGQSQFGMTREAAQARIQTLTQDRDWQSAYMAGDKAKAAELESLYKVVAGGGP